MIASAIFGTSLGSIAPSRLFELVSQSAATTLVTAIWQGAVIAACVWIGLRLAPRTTAAFRFAIWAAAFLVLVCVPFASSVPFPQFFTSSAPHFPSHLPSAFAPVIGKPWLEFDARWSLVITALWATASLVRAVDLVIHGIRLRKLWKTANPIALCGSPLSSLLAEITSRIPIINKRSLEICTTHALDRPSVIGFLSPRILIPEWLLEKLTPAELEQIILHETEHLRRGDDWTNLLQTLSLVVFPLNPVLLWVERKLRFEREMACDEGVIRFTHAPHAYATCLARLAESSVAHRMEALSLGFVNWSKRSELVIRVHSILRRKTALSPMGSYALSFALVLGMILTASGLSHAPQLVKFTVHPQVTQAESTSYEYSTPASLTQPGISPQAREVRTSASIRTLQPHLVRLRANLPSAPVAASNESVSSSIPSPSISRPHVSGSRKPRIQMTRAEMTKAEMGQPIVDPEGAQNWIVLSTWEQSQSADVTSSSDAPAGARASVTRVVFRVVSPNSSPTFAAVPTRNGWLFIQL
jgi:beta-lactamase regulating signal transducer with metallopeptidase domain